MATRGARLVSSQTVAPKTPGSGNWPHFTDGKQKLREVEWPMLPKSQLGRGRAGMSDQGHLSCLTPSLTLALVTSASMGWLALKIFCASC